MAAAARPPWHAPDVATPLVLPRDEFAQSLDAFPVEYRRDHRHARRARPARSVRRREDRAERSAARLEAQAASHLIHLRENYVEAAAGRAAVRRAGPQSRRRNFHAIVRHLARLDGVPAESSAALAHWASARVGLDARVVGDVLALSTEAAPGVDPLRLFPDYLSTVASLLHAIVDQWPAS